MAENSGLTIISKIKTNGIKYLHEIYREEGDYSLYELLYVSDSCFRNSKNSKLDSICYFIKLLVNNDPYIYHLINMDYSTIIPGKGSEFYFKFIDNLLDIINTLDSVSTINIYTNLLKMDTFKNIILEHYWIGTKHEHSFFGKIINSRIELLDSDINTIIEIIHLFDTFDSVDWFTSLLDKNKLYRQTYYIINNQNLTSLHFLNKVFLIAVHYYKYHPEGELFKLSQTGNTIESMFECQRNIPKNLTLDYIVTLIDISLIASIFKMNYSNKSKQNLQDLLEIESSSTRWNQTINLKNSYIKSIQININDISTKINTFKNILNENYMKNTLYIMNEIVSLGYKYNIINSKDFLKTINNIALILGYISATIPINYVNISSILDLLLIKLESSDFDYSFKMQMLDYTYTLTPEALNYMMDKGLVNTIIKIYIAVDGFTEMEDYDKNYIKNVIIKIMIKCKTDSTKFINPSISHLISIFLSDISVYFEDIVFSINTITTIKNNTTSLSETQVIRNEEILYYELVNINNYCKYFTNMLDLQQLFIQLIPEVVLEGINSNKLVSTINFWLIQLFTKHTLKSFKYDTYTKLNESRFNWDYLYHKIYQIYTAYIHNTLFIESIVYTVSDYTEFKTIMDDFNTNYILKNEFEDLHFNILLKSMDIIIDKQIIYNIDIPLEFCDPLLYTPIDEPTVLPESNIIIDKKTIINHLIHDKTDPFNRTPLTLDSLEEHNKKETTLVKLNDFVERFNIWKKQNIKLDE
uniref:U-box domain-containing protein n=1 Tax=viral metagenome TaxID=1070528 RepID=A0A6C0EIC5_9ZZZZ